MRREVHVWALALSDAATPAAYRSALTVDEQQRADSYRFDGDRYRWITARFALRSVLGAYLGISADAVRFHLNTYGKPGIADASSLHFNLSHTRKYAFIAIGCWPLGIDVETMDRNVQFVELAQRFFAREEVEILLGTPAAKRQRIFYKLWTRKEAYVKARGLGLSLPLRAFSVGLQDTSAIIQTEARWDDRNTWHCHDVGRHDDHVASLVCPHRDISVLQISWCPPEK